MIRIRYTHCELRFEYRGVKRAEAPTAVRAHVAQFAPELPAARTVAEWFDDENAPADAVGEPLPVPGS